MASTAEFKPQLHDLYERVHKALPKLFADEAAFLSFVDQTYGQPTRFFHGPQHLLNLTAQSKAETHHQSGDSTYTEWANRAYPEWAEKSYHNLEATLNAAYTKQLSPDEKKFMRDANLIAALNHDMEYHVDGKWTEYGKPVLEPYIYANGSQQPESIKTEAMGFPSREQDKVAHIVLDLFGMEPGKKLSPFAGQNEFLSALAMARKMESAGADIELIIAATAGVEATIPFREHKDTEQLQARLDQLYEKEPELKKRYPDETASRRRVDMIAGGANLLANQDVSGFLGGLGHHEHPNFQSVSRSMRDNQLLVTEEGGRELQQSKEPGVGFTAHQMLAPTFKRVRLNEFLLNPGKNNLFHSVKIRGNHKEMQYPPRETVILMNNTVRAPEHFGHAGNADIINIAYKARVAALALVHSIALVTGKENDDLVTLVGGLDKNAQWPLIPKKPVVPPAEQLAIDVLDHRPSGTDNDIRQSPIASSLLQGLEMTQVDALYKAAETHFGKKAGEKAEGEAYLKSASAIMGADKIKTLITAMVKAREAAKDYPSAVSIGRAAAALPKQVE